MPQLVYLISKWHTQRPKVQEASLLVLVVLRCKIYVSRTRSEAPETRRSARSLHREPFGPKFDALDPFSASKEVPAKKKRRKTILWFCQLVTLGKITHIGAILPWRLKIVTLPTVFFFPHAFFFKIYLRV